MKKVKKREGVKGISSEKAGNKIKRKKTKKRVDKGEWI